MKSAQMINYGQSDVVKITKIEKPKIDSGKLLIKVFAASINPVDWKIREGYFKTTMSLQFPVTLGGDFSGVIEEVGAGVTNFKKGDKVYGQAGPLRDGTGSFAEYVLANSQTVSIKPKKINYLEAAALPLVGVSALQALKDYIKLAKNQKILIHGGAGGIGSLAIQIAKYYGADIATTVSTKDIDFVKELGANEVIDYTQESFETRLRDYDAVFDTVGGETYKKSFTILKKNGIIVSMLEQPNTELMKKFGVESIFEFTKVDTEHLTSLAELVDKGVIKINIDKIFNLEQTAEAMSYQQKMHPRGKVVLDITKTE